ncbi:SDR family oxidoreductase [Shinella zoogloeoides]|uniref:NAD(P)H-binding protein n=1 Tax=Shinella zoogloeoides TaxID=352475 RepID=A0A6N8TF50_SHIZO|nr:SDR family oxidoreductase [Shinella zoogloeoides]MXO01035.1 NAD(P)H-binding protein [Shinella zoogloeoides]UEX80559.1 SDR family oxidoreductase [Shinella zoogloeoides]
MSNVLVLGAGGQIARHVIGMLGGEQGMALTLFARNTARLARVPANTTLVQGDVLDPARLAEAVKGQDIVYANLTGEDLDDQAKAVIDAMQAEGVQRLVFVLSLGIYQEVPGKFGEWNEAIIGEDLKPFRRAADAIEASGLDYTILRPAWLMDEDEVDYETTGRNEPFKGTVVSRKSVADLIARTIRAPKLHSRANFGVNKPNTDADKPYFM